MLSIVLFFGGFMPEEGRPVRLVFTVDFDSPDWLHIQNAQTIITTLQDLPRPLHNRIRPFALALMQRRIAVCEYHSDRTPRMTVDGHPFHFELLNIQDMPGKLALLEWWIAYQHKRSLAQPDFIGRQPHKTWKCECGEDVKPAKPLCENRTCPSWNLFVECTGQKLRLVKGGT